MQRVTRSVMLAVFVSALALQTLAARCEAPYAANAPRFALPGKSVQITAYAPGAEVVAITWEGAQGSGEADMSYNAESGMWEAEIPGEDVIRPSLQYHISSWDGEKAQESPQYIIVVSSESTVIGPKQMKLTEKVVVKRGWNSGADAFGLLTMDGDYAGPAAVAYSRGVIYLLDSIKSRILGFDRDGKMVSTVALPENDATDLIIDPADSSMLVINQYQGSIFRVTDDQVKKLGVVDGLRRMVFPSKFIYSKATDTIFAEDPLTNTLVRVMKDGVPVDQKNRRTKERLSTVADASGKNLVLGLKGGKSILSVAMDKAITSVEEVVTDRKGVVWVLYSLDGDYRMRRLARVDAKEGTAEVAEAKDVWFRSEATRRMAGTESGVVVFASDPQEGRIISYQYEGGGLQ